MQVFKYILKLLDPLFYSLEGFSGAYTPPMIHATAINFAALNVLNYEPSAQPYIMADSNGGRNIPRYSDSRASGAFYFTPAKLPRLSSLDYLPDLTKGEHDRYLQTTKRGEVLKISKLHYIPPETSFEGYLLLTYPIDLTPLEFIRLGSFRGKAQLNFGKKELKIKGDKQDCYVDHLVDPLVSKVKRGVAKNILPYPLIDNALVARAIVCKEGHKDICVALPETEITYDREILLEKLADLKKTLNKLESLSAKEQCEGLMYVLRSSVSIYYFLRGISTEKFLNERLREIDGFLELRNAIRDNIFQIDHVTLRHLREIAERDINDCQEKIKGGEKSQIVKGSGDSSPTLIL
jgi:hypothetical protein